MTAKQLALAVALNLATMVVVAYVLRNVPELRRVVDWR